MPSAPHNRRLHYVALATAAATFPLVLIGAKVTSHGAGMSVPDWPHSYGYNMVLFPPSQWVGGILYEHTHRLLGTLVGFLAVVLTLTAWGPAANRQRRKLLIGSFATSVLITLLIGLMLVSFSVVKEDRVATIKSNLSHGLVGFAGLALTLGVAIRCRRPDPRRGIRWLCTAVLAAVIVQGTLGGLRVVLVNIDFAIVHACFAQATFCLIAFTCLATGRGWPTLPALRGTLGPSIARWAVALSAVVYVQLIVGASMRHNDAGLAVPDLPLHYGHVLPPIDQASLAAANLARANSDSPDLWRPVTLTQIWLHVGHRLGAVLVTLAAAVVIWKATRPTPLQPFVKRPAIVLSALLVVQITLGVLTVVLHKPADIASLHVAVGALVLITSVVLAAKAVRAVGLRRTNSHPLSPVLGGEGGGEGPNVGERGFAKATS